MRDNKKSRQLAEQFVRHVITQTFHQTADEELIRETTDGVLKVTPKVDQDAPVAA